VEFYGTIKPGDVLDLEWLSHATGDKGRETYKFVPVTFLK